VPTGRLPATGIEPSTFSMANNNKIQTAPLVCGRAAIDLNALYNGEKLSSSFQFLLHLTECKELLPQSDGCGGDENGVYSGQTHLAELMSSEEHPQRTEIRASESSSAPHVEQRVSSHETCSDSSLLL